MIQEEIMNGISLDTIESALEDIRQGKVVIVVDDEDRENEGDFICAAEKVTPEIINFMATHGRGLICAPITEQRARELDLYPMVGTNTSMHETAFTVSIDLIGRGCTTGISAYDRATGIKRMVEADARSEEFAKPGHIFPLIAKNGGVLRRTGHTEAAIDLARLAGFSPAGVLIEILNEDGTMARLPQLAEIARKHDLKLISIKDLVAYRLREEKLVKHKYTEQLDTPYGLLDFIVFEQITTGDEHLVIRKGQWTEEEIVPVRVQSYMAWNDGIFDHVFNKETLEIEKALQQIQNLNKGMLLVMHHKEKTKDPISIIKEYKSGESSTEELHSQRDYGIGAQILLEMNVRKLNLITSHPRKRVALDGYGLEIVEFLPL
ncbi:3,4-dihydroxy-2-butanone-4-phosphate synthase [Membranicola marinus]|uniref:3,4-dihydroxy-2-butanone 4-phosphate synthase n=2 Tax=Membranihabitans marinus TaxID=1227546 RepID=A0A953HV71_9BACT|nr:3,4-dihydroxy-2-butanone-4-phosphate synthase [Membranihabitans marinus]MBY5959045.1 3,4-dihydroxy-2-butanone-4-phosphate synthase [Membranihabitans marinus]